MILTDFSQVMSKAISHKSKIDNAKMDYEDNLIRIEEKGDELYQLSDLQKTMEMSYACLERLINTESERFIKRVEGLVSFGLETIFFDEEYSCEIRLDSSNNATIHLVTKDDEGNRICPNIKDGVGGGIRTVVGIMLQVFFIFHTRSEPILFVDEGFSQLSDIYLPRLFAFLRELADKEDMKVVLITHDERIVPYADRVYKVDRGMSFLLAGDALEEVKELNRLEEGSD